MSYWIMDTNKNNFHQNILFISWKSVERQQGLNSCDEVGYMTTHYTIVYICTTQLHTIYMLKYSRDDWILGSI